MALIAMAVFDTEENMRTSYTHQTFVSLTDTVDFRKHRVIVVDNGSCDDTQKLFDRFEYLFTIIRGNDNVGTAKAINKAWADRKPGENCIKMDNDVVINHKGWVDEMDEAIRREPLIGQVGLKRKDCWESPERTDFYKSKLLMLPHNAGEKWVVAEKVNHVMGTCVMHSSALLDKIGYLYQPRLYGFDDALMSLRSQLAGFINVFLPHIDIDHIDTGTTSYQKWKEKHSSEQWKEYHKTVEDYKTGKRSLYEIA